MIARLEGRLLEKTPTRVLVDVSGVGYAAEIPLSTFERLPEEGKTVALRVHTHVREDALQLFGFASEAERSVFELLLHASRVGPRLAQTILSGIEAASLVHAIRGGDVAALKAVPGVGAKTAERIVVELRDRAAALDAPPAAEGAPPPAPAPAEPETQREVVSALQNLQIARARAERVAGEVVEALGAETPLEALVREALRRLAR